MSSHCRRWLALAACGVYAALLHGAIASAGNGDLRVCADPDNLPYSRADEHGFENRIASLLATELRMPLRYYWMPQRRGFVRKTLGARLCDVIIGVPVGLEGVLTTRAYYRSGYVLVYRADGDAPYASLDDSRLRNRRIGVQLPGEDMAATPPGEALARRGVVDNVIGYTAFGERPAAARMIEALASDRLDVALMWGPQAGYFVITAAQPLKLVALHGDALPGAAPFTFAIAIGVRRDDAALRDRLDAALAKLQPQIDAVLNEFGVPRDDFDDPVSARLARARGPAATAPPSMRTASMSTQSVK